MKINIDIVEDKKSSAKDISEYNYTEPKPDNRVAIRRGCENQMCNCTGSCEEIIAYRDKLPNEH